MDSTCHTPSVPALIDPLVREISRIASIAESRPACDHPAVDDLLEEIRRLRETVALLRVSAKPVPLRLRPVVARAMCG